MFVKFGKKKKKMKRKEKKTKRLSNEIKPDVCYSSAKNVMMQQMAEKARKMKKFHLREHLASN